MGGVSFIALVWHPGLGVAAVRGLCTHSGVFHMAQGTGVHQPTVQRRRLVCCVAPCCHSHSYMVQAGGSLLVRHIWGQQSRESYSCHVVRCQACQQCHSLKGLPRLHLSPGSPSNTCGGWCCYAAHLLLGCGGSTGSQQSCARDSRGSLCRHTGGWGLHGKECCCDSCWRTCGRNIALLVAACAVSCLLLIRWIHHCVQ